MLMVSVPAWVQIRGAEAAVEGFGQQAKANITFKKSLMIKA